MKKATVVQLNNLNKNFYQKIATSFDQTRQGAWLGWKKLLPTIQKVSNSTNTISVLDLGCGNARFFTFLEESGFSIDYLGVDSDSHLLKLASENIYDHKNTFRVKQLDLIQLLIDDELLSTITNKFNLIVAFGVLHHIPSIELRTKFIIDISKLLKNLDSQLIITNWQFASDERFKNKFIDPAIAGINSQDLEKNDFILGWQNQADVYRYCHFTDEKEMSNIHENINDLTLLDSFIADGKSGKLNQYLVFKSVKAQKVKQ